MAAKRLLTVDDEHGITALFRGIALEMGFDVRVANDAPGFVAAYEAFAPDVILLDVAMPGMDGFETLQFLAARKSAARIVIISGMGETFRIMAERFGSARGLAIAGNLAKPVRVAELRRLLGEIRDAP